MRSAVGTAVRELFLAARFLGIDQHDAVLPDRNGLRKGLLAGGVLAVVAHLGDEALVHDRVSAALMANGVDPLAFMRGCSSV
jgi:hypothetical protein